jgi:hypothetical protein
LGFEDSTDGFKPPHQIFNLTGVIGYENIIDEGNLNLKNNLF